MNQEAWNYSFASDVVGRLIEVISGQSLEEFPYQRIFKPLEMNQTAFYIDDEYIKLNGDELMAVYSPRYQFVNDDNE